MPKITKIRKRDGSLQDYRLEKIQNAILKALDAARQDKKNFSVARKISEEVQGSLEKHFASIAPSVEDVQDIIEETLMKNKLTEAAKAYIIYRQKHKETREFKTFLGVRDDLKMSANALTVLARRYLLRNENGDIVETPSRLFRRVAKAIASTDALYEKALQRKQKRNFIR